MDSGGPSSSSHGEDDPPEQIRFYGVIPKTWCEHLIPDNLSPVPAAGIDANSPCAACHDQTENWICLKCYEVYCSRFVNEDMKRHREERGHELVLSLADLSVWCFACDAYINNAVTQAAKEAAYLSKFGEGFPAAAAGMTGTSNAARKSDSDSEPDR